MPLFDCEEYKIYRDNRILFSEFPEFRPLPSAYTGRIPHSFYRHQKYRCRSYSRQTNRYSLVLEPFVMMLAVVVANEIDLHLHLWHIERFQEQEEDQPLNRLKSLLSCLLAGQIVLEIQRSRRIQPQYKLDRPKISHFLTHLVVFDYDYLLVPYLFLALGNPF